VDYHRCLHLGVKNAKESIFPWFVEGHVICSTGTQYTAVKL
ncbi:uncharacterized protein METZ01_LOCUS240642, partial [marine metagenome]